MLYKTGMGGCKGICLAGISVALVVLVMFCQTPEAEAYHTKAPKFTLTNFVDCSSFGGDGEVRNGTIKTGDGICDDWEENSQSLGYMEIDYNTPAGKTPYRFDCIAHPPCPSPEKLDVFVEIDYMEGHYPDQQAIQQVKDAFSNSPQQIELHVIVDEQVKPYDYWYALWPGYDWEGYPQYHGFDQIKREHFGTPLERGAVETDWDNWEWKQKAQVFHYGLFLHYLWGYGCASGIAEFHGNDFVVSLGCFENGVGNTDQQAGTLMHELGHNLGLWHGGGDNENCKPNYLSVMSYSRQFKDYISDRPLDYSRVKQGTINTPPDNEMITEVATDEAGGIDQSSPPGLKTVWSDGSIVRIGPVNPGGMDYDMDGVYDDDDHNLNNFGGCGGDSMTDLIGHNDWANLRFNFRDNTGTASDGSSGERQITGQKLQPTASELKRAFPSNKTTAQIQTQLDRVKFNITSSLPEITIQDVKMNRLLRLDSLMEKLPMDELKVTHDKELKSKAEKMNLIRDFVNKGQFDKSVNFLEEIKSQVQETELINEIEEVIKLHEIARQVTYTDVYTPIGNATCNDIEVSLNSEVDVNMRYCSVDVAVTGKSFDRDSKTLQLNVTSENGGQISLQTNRFLDSKNNMNKDNKYAVKFDGNPVNFQEIQNTKNQRTLTIEIPPATSSTLEFVGTKVVGDFNTPAPVNQDVEPSKTVCKFGFEMIFKPSGDALCLKPNTAEKLLERWTRS